MTHSQISSIFIASHIAFITLFIWYSYRKGWLKLDHRSLFHQKIFWISITLPFISFVIYGCWAWYGHHPDLSAAGFEEFYKISKVPLLFLAASVPLAAIVNNIHRTIQTAKQILEAETKNRSDTYFNHFKFMLESFKGIKGEKIDSSYNSSSIELKINKPISLYNRIFYKSSSFNGADYSVNPSFKKLIIKNWHDIIISADRISKLPKDISLDSKKNHIKTLLINWYRIERAYMEISKLLFLEKYQFTSKLKYTYDNFELYSAWRNLDDMESSISELEKITSKVIDIINDTQLLNTIFMSKVQIRDVERHVVRLMSSLNRNIVVDEAPMLTIH